MLSVKLLYNRYNELRHRVYKPSHPLTIRELEARVKQFRRRWR